MGYTHYFCYAPEHPAFRAAWPRIVADAARIAGRVRAAGIVLTALDDAVVPVHDGGIGFNGSVADELDGEAFVVHAATVGLQPWLCDEHGVVRTFCKTERFPYDVAVAAILLRCHLIVPEAFLIGSDGAWDQEWARDLTFPPAGGLSARALVGELFGGVPAAAPFSDTRTGLRGVS